MAQCAQLLTQKDVLAVPTSSRKLVVAIFTKWISQKFTLSNETKPQKLFVFIKAQIYPKINNKRKQAKLRSMTNRWEQDKVCTNTSLVLPLQTLWPSFVVHVASTGLSLCVLVIGRPLRSKSLSLMWKKKHPFVCHVASVIITESDFYEIRYERSAQQTVNRSWNSGQPGHWQSHFSYWPVYHILYIFLGFSWNLLRHKHKNVLSVCEFGENLGGVGRALLPDLNKVVSVISTC